MSSNTAITLLRFDLSNITMFEPMSPFKLTYDLRIANKTALWLNDDITDLCLASSDSVYPSNTNPCPRWEEKTRSDSYCTKGAAKTTSTDTLRLIDYVCLDSNMRLQSVQTRHFGCPNPLLSIPLYLPHTHTDTRLVYYINAGCFTSCQRQIDSSEECDKVGARLTV